MKVHCFNIFVVKKQRVCIAIVFLVNKDDALAVPWNHKFNVCQVI